MKNTCIFCEIASKNIPGHIVHETKDFVAFLDIHPNAPGHTLLIPKTHIPTMMDANEKIVVEGMKEAHMLMKKYRDIFNVSHVKLMVYGVDVDHLHIHVIPIYKNNPAPLSLEKAKEMIIEGLK